MSRRTWGGNHDPLRTARCRPYRQHSWQEHRRHRRRQSWSRSLTPTPEGGEEPGRAPPAREVREHRRHHRRQGHRCGPDRHADRHPCRPDRAGGQGRKGGASARSRSTSTAKRIEACLKVVEAGGHAADDRLQPPFRPEFRRRCKKRIDAGAIGKVELVTILSRDPGPPPVSYIERSGGLFRDMMIHDLDMARFLLGEEPVEVHARRLVAGRSGDRQGRRRRHRRGAC